jgi:hypothetical protein
MNTAPVKTGLALAVTVATGYIACALVFWLWPEAAAAFMNALFHGLDFRKLQSGASLFTFHAFIYALLVIVAWAFVLGSLFGWAQRYFVSPR